MQSSYTNNIIYDRKPERGSRWLATCEILFVFPVKVCWHRKFYDFNNTEGIFSDCSCDKESTVNMKTCVCVSPVFRPPVTCGALAVLKMWPNNASFPFFLFSSHSWQLKFLPCAHDGVTWAFSMDVFIGRKLTISSLRGEHVGFCTFCISSNRTFHCPVVWQHVQPSRWQTNPKYTWRRTHLRTWCTVKPSFCCLVHYISWM